MQKTVDVIISALNQVLNVLEQGVNHMVFRRHRLNPPRTGEHEVLSLTAFKAV
jgi:hypothetical protein